jgi:hypothetical protein
MCLVGSWCKPELRGVPWDGSLKFRVWGWQQDLNPLWSMHTQQHSMQHANFGPTSGHQDSTTDQAPQHVSGPPGCGLSPPLYSTGFGCALPQLQPTKVGKYACQFSGHNSAQTALIHPSSVPTGPPPPGLQRKVLRDFTPFLPGFQAHQTTFKASSPCKSRGAWPFMRNPIVSTPSAGPGIRSLASPARQPSPGSCACVWRLVVHGIARPANESLGGSRPPRYLPPRSYHILMQHGENASSRPATAQCPIDPICASTGPHPKPLLARSPC